MATNSLVGLPLFYDGRPVALNSASSVGAILAVTYGRRHDFIYADPWPGEFARLSEALALHASGGFYVGDDLLLLPNRTSDRAPNVPASSPDWNVRGTSLWPDFARSRA